MEPSEALEIVDEIESMAESEALPYAAEEFAASVREKAVDIGETIYETGRVSEAQERALINMRDGLARWFWE